MSDPRKIFSAPCLIDEGVLINKKDIMRALETLENVKYVHSVDGQVISQGEGVIVKVFSSRETSTIIVNGCIYLNVQSFNYLRFSPYQKGLSTVELVDDGKVLKLVPLDEDAKKLVRTNRSIGSSDQLPFDEESPALFDELGDEEDD